MCRVGGQPRSPAAFPGSGSVSDNSTDCNLVGICCFSSCAVGQTSPAGRSFKTPTSCYLLCDQDFTFTFYGSYSEIAFGLSLLSSVKSVLQSVLLSSELPVKRDTSQQSPDGGIIYTTYRDLTRPLYQETIRLQLIQDRRQQLILCQSCCKEEKVLVVDVWEGSETLGSRAELPGASIPASPGDTTPLFRSDTRCWHEFPF